MYLDPNILSLRKVFGRADVSLGVGWGRLAGNGVFSNPLRSLIRSFFDEPLNPVYGLGGDVSFADFFSGPRVGLFGGVKYSF